MSFEQRGFLSPDLDQWRELARKRFPQRFGLLDDSSDLAQRCLYEMCRIPRLTAQALAVVQPFTQVFRTMTLDETWASLRTAMEYARYRDSSAVEKPMALEAVCSFDRSALSADDSRRLEFRDEPLLYISKSHKTNFGSQSAAMDGRRGHKNRFLVSETQLLDVQLPSGSTIRPSDHLLR